MAELSGFWTTGGTVGDQQTSYTQAQWSTAARILAACCGFEGVASGYLNEPACTANGANTVAVNTGGGMVDGKWFINDASQDVNIPSASGGGNTRIDRIVLRATWASFNVSVTRIAGTDAASPTAPAITQTSGTTYDIQLCQVLVDTAGAVTVTDERTWAAVGTDGIGTAAVTLAKMAANSIDSDQYIDGSIDLAHMSANSVDSDQYVDGSIDTVHIGDSQVTAVKIANRTRTFVVQGQTPATTLAGSTMADNATTEVYGFFYAPPDYVSGLSVQALVWPAATGNLYCSIAADYGAAGEDYDANVASSASSAVAVTAEQISAIKSITLTDIAAGDSVSMYFTRTGGNAADTVGAAVYFRGFLVTYTADS